MGVSDSDLVGRAGFKLETPEVFFVIIGSIRPEIAMTGEITLRGKVTPIGGVKEKILAAKRAGITDLLLCEDNRRDVEEIEPRYLDGLKFHYINEMSEAMPLALVDEVRPKGRTTQRKKGEKK